MMKQTSQTLDNILEQFEKMVHELVTLGYSADKAVQIAYTTLSYYGDARGPSYG